MRPAGAAPVVGRTKYASHAPSGVVMLTSDSLVATALAVGAITAPDAAAVGAGAGPGAGSADLHPIGRSDARPAPSEREPKPRRDRSSGRRRYSTMSSKESLSHMAASRRVLRRCDKRVTSLAP